MPQRFRMRIGRLEGHWLLNQLAYRTPPLIEQGLDASRSHDIANENLNAAS